MTIQINTLPLNTTPIPGANWVVMSHPMIMGQCWVEISDEVLAEMARLELAPEGQKLHAAIEQLVAEAKANPDMSVDDIASRAAEWLAEFWTVNPIQRMMAFSKAQAYSKVLMALHRKIGMLMVWTAIGCPSVEEDRKSGKASDYANSEGREVLQIWLNCTGNGPLAQRYTSIRESVRGEIQGI